METSSYFVFAKILGYFLSPWTVFVTGLFVALLLLFTPWWRAGRLLMALA
ncbi:MAG: hypothetical protein HQL36_07905, partial [Alphaproteobacteria bacterium]|nr:hypothetical protein [Alphaproteobacteria bacterium]